LKVSGGCTWMYKIALNNAIHESGTNAVIGSMYTFIAKHPIELGYRASNVREGACIRACIRACACLRK